MSDSRSPLFFIYLSIYLSAILTTTGLFKGVRVRFFGFSSTRLALSSSSVGTAEKPAGGRRLLDNQEERALADDHAFGVSEMGECSVHQFRKEGYIYTLDDEVPQSQRGGRDNLPVLQGIVHERQKPRVFGQQRGITHFGALLLCFVLFGYVEMREDEGDHLTASCNEGYGSHCDTCSRTTDTDMVWRFIFIDERTDAVLATYNSRLQDAGSTGEDPDPPIYRPTAVEARLQPNR